MSRDRKSNRKNPRANDSCERSTIVETNGTRTTIWHIRYVTAVTTPVTIALAARFKLPVVFLHRVRSGEHSIGRTTTAREVLTVTVSRLE